MKLSKAFGFSLLIAALGVAGLHAQTGAASRARLVARGGTVETQRGNVWIALNPGEEISPGQRVRTGGGSTAALELGPGKIITLSERTEVQIRDSNGSPFVQLETGNMKVVSAETIQVAAKDTTLESTEPPLDMEVGIQADRLNLTVITGAVRNGQMTIRGAEDTSKRTFTAGGRWRTQENTPQGNALVYPGMYFYPYVIYAGPNGFGPQTTAPQGGIVPPVVLNPTHPGYRPEQIVPPMSDPLRVPVQPPKK